MADWRIRIAQTGRLVLQRDYVHGIVARMLWYLCDKRANVRRGYFVFAVPLNISARHVKYYVAEVAGNVRGIKMRPDLSFQFVND